MLKGESMDEYYLIALTEPDLRAIRRILRTIEKHSDMSIENIVITIRLRNNPRATGALGGLMNVSDNIILLRGVIPLPSKPK